MPSALVVRSSSAPETVFDEVRAIIVDLFFGSRPSWRPPGELRLGTLYLGSLPPTAEAAVFTSSVYRPKPPLTLDTIVAVTSWAADDGSVARISFGNLDTSRSGGNRQEVRAREDLRDRERLTLLTLEERLLSLGMDVQDDAAEFPIQMYLPGDVPDVTGPAAVRLHGAAVMTDQRRDERLSVVRAEKATIEERVAQRQQEDEASAARRFRVKLTLVLIVVALLVTAIIGAIVSPPGEATISPGEPLRVGLGEVLDDLADPVSA